MNKYMALVNTHILDEIFMNNDYFKNSEIKNIVIEGTKLELEISIRCDRMHKLDERVIRPKTNFELSFIGVKKFNFINIEKKIIIDKVVMDVIDLDKMDEYDVYNSRHNVAMFLGETCILSFQCYWGNVRKIELFYN